MASGNASNTVFTSIPVGEDFTMTFSTVRFFKSTNPGDILSLTFKLYDATKVGDVSNPSDAALIYEKNNQPYDVDDNPNGAPSIFDVGSKYVKVRVSSADLDTWAQSEAGGGNDVFRGELYGYVFAEIGGVAAGDATAICPNPVSGGMYIPPVDVVFGANFWDGYVLPGECVVTVSVSIPSVGVDF